MLKKEIFLMVYLYNCFFYSMKLLEVLQYALQIGTISCDTNKFDIHEILAILERFFKFSINL